MKGLADVQNMRMQFGQKTRKKTRKKAKAKAKKK